MPVYVDKIVINEVVKEVDKIVINEVVKEVEKVVVKEVPQLKPDSDEEPVVQFQREKKKVQRSGTPPGIVW